MAGQALDISLSEASGAALTTRCGLDLKVRPVSIDDYQAVALLYSELTPDDIRFRFLSSRTRLTSEQLVALVNVDHRHSEHLLAFDSATGKLVASLVMVADERMEVAEVAIVVTPAYKNRGIGWTLLKHATELASSRGIRRLRCIETRENRRAIEVERASGFHASNRGAGPDEIIVEAKLG